MPVAGVVITTRPDDRDQTLQALAGVDGLEVHASDGQGNIVAVLDTRTLDAMEDLVRKVSGIETILNVGITYLNAEDELGRIVMHGHRPRIFGARRDERS